MTPEEIDREAEALYAYLCGDLPRTAPGLPSEQADLAASLQTAARNIHPDPQFQVALENRLVATLQSTGRNAKRAEGQHGRMNFAWGSTVAWGIGALLLLLGLSWMLNNLIPRPTPGAGPNAQPAYPDPYPSEAAYPYPKPTGPVYPYPMPSEPAYPLPYPPAVLPENQPMPLPTQTSALWTGEPAGSAQVYSLPQMPEVDFTLQLVFPETPAKVSLYQQQPWPALTAESARRAAQGLGIDGEVYQAPGYSTDNIRLVVSNGLARAIFQTAPPWFQYDRLGDPADSPAGQEQIAEQASAIAERFIQQSDLPAFDYRIQTQPGAPGLVSLVQTLQGIPLRLTSLGTAQVQVQVNGQGQIVNAHSSIINPQAIGEYPILSAQEAWQKATTPDNQNGVETYTTLAVQPNLHTWQRTYPLDSPVELFGYAIAYQSAVPGQPPLILFNDYPVSGNTQGLAEAASNNRFVQAWGQFQANDLGGRTFQIEGWQRSAFPMKNLEGVIERQADQAYLVTQDQKLLLPDLPAKVPQGETVYSMGIVVDNTQPALEWSIISTAPLGGGGGGGGSYFSEINLSGTPVPPAPLQPTPTPVPLPVQTIAGEQGTPIVMIHQYSDGSTRVDVTMTLQPSNILPDGLMVRLEGPGLAGIETYHNLPVRVWGKFDDPSNTEPLPVLTIERFEAVYPGVKVQAWLGLAEQVTLQGKQVLLFTSQQGEQFVLESSLSQSWSSTGPVVVEGIAPADLRFGDYPILRDYSFSPATGMDNLDDYQIMSAQPYVIQESGTAGERQSVVIEKIELVYLTNDPYIPIAAPDEPPAYIQPAWLFSGHYTNGSTFELLVQALRPEYLK